MTTNLNLSDDIIDVRDIITRIEELQASLGDIVEGDPECVASEQEELDQLLAIMEELKGNGGDEQWNGDWYPITLIADSHFEDYAEELAEDCGDYDSNALAWPLTCIDWEKAALELQTDYTPLDIDGNTYWTR